MQLETEVSGTREVCDEAQLREALGGDVLGKGFIILSQAPQNYIQAGDDGNGSYAMEYRDGDDAHHFQARNQYTKEQVLQAFCWYLAGDPRWRSEYSWQKLESRRWWKFW